MVVGSFTSTLTLGEDSIAQGPPFDRAAAKRGANPVRLREPLGELPLGDVHHAIIPERRSTNLQPQSPFPTILNPQPHPYGSSSRSERP